MREQQPLYPVYVISKGRFENCPTAKTMEKDRVDFRLVVEPQDADEYRQRFGQQRVSVLPFSNLGLGSIPARNWVWEHAKEAGHARHWIIDDNIFGVFRRYKTQRLHSRWGVALRVVEDFTDRYENIAIAGMNYGMFCSDREKVPPFVPNVHVYSCLLIRNDLSVRWRGRYNEDTDLCLQVLSEGWCTVLVNAFLVQKAGTMTLKGGNLDELYQGDGRLEMARSLERAWPGIVKVKRRFGRSQHVINWKKFDTPLKRRPDIDFEKLKKQGNEYGMRLNQTRPVIQSKVMIDFLDGQSQRGCD